ncbi:hypothetical protein [Tahibacter sp.]|uniref:hypothetical protein n=1 Tax=Tahibacter sp. TaxID=2056211 RepID=UPI0028C50869|nr:hypothetical protein [Tahibacter sp.]
MFNVLKFLERAGGDSRLRNASTSELSAALQHQSLDAELREALVARDQKRLEQLLGARTNVVCGMAPAEDDAPSKKEEEEEIRSAQDMQARAA